MVKANQLTTYAFIAISINQLAGAIGGVGYLISLKSLLPSFSLPLTYYIVFVMSTFLSTLLGIFSLKAAISKSAEFKSYTFMLLGIMLIFTAIALIYTLVIIGGVLEAFIGYASIAGGPVPSTDPPLPLFNTFIIAGWLFAIYELISGFVTLSAGVAFLVRK